MLQLNLPVPPRRGGARPGAGRKRSPSHPRRTPHRERPTHRANQPVHITLRAGIRSLRHQYVARTVIDAMRASNREHFRVVHYSVQENHVHLIVEARNKASLSAGVRGLMVRVARRVNGSLFRRGRFWADRWHGHALTSPREVRNALVYVLQNHRKHGAGAGDLLDALSSAQWFDGFARLMPRTFHSVGPPSVVPARTWLLRIGWQRRGLIQYWEAPKKGDAPMGRVLMVRATS